MFILLIKGFLKFLGGLVEDLDGGVGAVINIGGGVILSCS